MKKPVRVLLVAGLLLAGCNSPGGEGDANDSLTSEKAYDDVYVTEVPLPDGSSVLCVIFHSYQEGGISCDWGRVSMG